MSWNTAKKRFQKDVDKYPAALRKVLLDQTDKYTLPTFERMRYIPTHERRTTMEQVGIATGDMVYIAEGEHKGKVSPVLQYSAASDCFLLTDILAKRAIPKPMWIPNQQSFLMDYPVAIPREHVRLAAKDRDETGKVSYVVAEELIYKSKYYDDNYKRWLPRRFVKHHLNIEIPWPRPPSEPRDDELSTPKDAALLKTFELQTIAKSPLPKGLLNELRNPYSPHKKRGITEFEARKLNGVTMPLSAAQKEYLAKKSQTPEKKLTPLSEEVKDYIGAKMAEHISKIDNPALLAHLEVLSKSRVRDFETTMKKIAESSQ